MKFLTGALPAMELSSTLDALHTPVMPLAMTNGKLLKFPPDFLWGTATSTTQIEGHINNEWTDFVARDGKTCERACDSYHRYPEDIEWMTRLGVNAYRLGIEWSRLQSAPYAALDQKELARYSDQLDRLNAANILPMVVLHHFSNPPWINASGGWENRATVLAFADYVVKLARALRDRVRIWNTFNEPDTYVSCGYFLGEFPPQKKGRWWSCRKIIKNMAWAHHEACHIVRDTGSPLGPVEVGFSKNWTHFEPYWKWSPWDSLVASWSHAQFNEFVLEEFLSGKGSDAPTYQGVNYYGRVRFKNLRALVPAFGVSCEELAKMGVTCDDMLERHPIGLESALNKIYQRAKLPIYLTEHGSASDNEVFREQDLLENLTALHRAITGGVDVRGFYYWSLLDNFEWQFGYEKKFGLIGVDFSDEKLTRKMKPLGEVYHDVCLNNGI